MPMLNGGASGPASVFVVTTAFPFPNAPLDGARTMPHGWALFEQVTVTFPAAFTTPDARPTFCSGWLVSVTDCA